MLVLALNIERYFYNFEALGFGERDGKMYYKIQKDKSKEYFGTSPRVFVTLGPTTYTEGPVPSSGAQSWGVPHRYYYKRLKHKRDFHWLFSKSVSF